MTDSESFFREVRHCRGETVDISAAGEYRMDAVELIGIQIPSGRIYVFAVIKCIDSGIGVLYDQIDYFAIIYSPR